MATATPWLNPDFRRFNQLVTVQSKSVTRDAYGGEIVSWGTFAQLWAAVQPVGGAEYREAEQAQSDATVRILTRYVSGLLPTMRIVHGSNTYEIVSVRNIDSRGDKAELMCRQAVL